MKFITPYLIIFSLLLTSVSCGSTVTEKETKVPATIGTNNLSTEKTGVAKTESIEDFIKEIEENLVNLEKEEQKEGECNIEKYTTLDGQTVKVKTGCYDGSFHSCRTECYYKNAKAYVAKVHHVKYNASPMDKENFDESKNIITQRLVFFKDGDLSTIDKMLDENNEPARIEGNLEMGWEQAISFLGEKDMDDE